MARPRKSDTTSSAAGIGGLSGWAEMLGEALGRGVARGLNAGLGSTAGAASAPNSSAPLQVGVRRGRPPRVKAAGPVPAEPRCKVEGCPNKARSKGLCSKHYQAERRRLLAKGKSR